MEIKAKRIALGGVMAALSITIMLVGAVMGIGMYAAPMLAGLCLLLPARQLGRKWHLLLWIAVSLLCLMLIADMEQNLMYICLFGCYPIFRPGFQRLKKPIRLLLKLIYFNAVVLTVETVVLLLFAPEVLGQGMVAVLMILGNITFLCYDFFIPVFEIMLERRFKKRFKAGR